MPRVAGHALRSEGWPFDHRGHLLPSVGGSGCGKCECGELSPWVPTRAARKRWHAEHKAEMLAKK